MKSQFGNYLDTLGMTKPLIDRADAALSFYEQILTEPILDLFVSEYVDGDGSRKFESLWFFSATAVMEAKGFVSEDHYDFCRFEENAVYWIVKRKDFLTEGATEQSRLVVTVNLRDAADTITAGFKASGTNCDKLWAVFKGFFVNRRDVVSSLSGEE